MRWLEVRRHSLTKKGTIRGRGSHLSAKGVVLARMVGESLGPFVYVVTSVSPRAIETALAMGFAVDDTIELPSGYVAGEVDHHDQWRWPRPYRTYAELVARPSRLAGVAEAHRVAWTQVVEAVPDGAAALVVGHGGGIEPGLVACLPDADHESWGAPFSHCDGARLCFNEGKFVSIEFRRAPATLLPGTSASTVTRDLRERGSAPRFPVVPW
jgi:broad specificity phosphatase PhoE